MVSSQDAETVFGKDQYSFSIKFIRRLGICTRNIPNKGILQQVQSQYQNKWKETQSNSTKTRHRTTFSTLNMYSIQYLKFQLKQFDNYRRPREYKSEGKKKIKVSSFSDDLMLYLNEAKSFTIEGVSLINPFNIQLDKDLTQKQKAVAFIYLNNKQTKKKNQGNNSFHKSVK